MALQKEELNELLSKAIIKVENAHQSLEKNYIIRADRFLQGVRDLLWEIKKKNNEQKTENH